MNKGLEEFLNHDLDGVFIIGHSSALARLNDQLFLFDPVWDHKPYGDHWTFHPRQINCDSLLGKIVGTFISHIHEDHICEKILRQVEGTVHIMGGRKNLDRRVARAHRQSLAHTPYKWVDIAPGVKAYFVPHAFNSIDSSVVVRANYGGSNKNETFTIYHGNDNFLDEKVIRRIKDDIDHIDVALLPTKFIHWWPFLQKNITEEKRHHEIKRMMKQCSDQAYLFIDELKPQIAIPFGASLYYSEAPDHILNRHLYTEDVGMTKLLAGSYVLSNGLIGEHTEKEPFDGHYFPRIRPDYEISREQLTALRQKVSRAPRLPDHEIIVNHIVIDTETGEVSMRYHAGEKPFTQFAFDRHELQLWLDEEITFEQAIGSRRFEFIRIPDIYRLEVFEWFNNYL